MKWKTTYNNWGELDLRCKHWHKSQVSPDWVHVSNDTFHDPSFAAGKTEKEAFENMLDDLNKQLSILEKAREEVLKELGKEEGKEDPAR